MLSILLAQSDHNKWILWYVSNFSMACKILPSGNPASSERVKVVQLLRQCQRACWLDSQNEPYDITKEIARVRRHAPL